MTVGSGGYTVSASTSAKTTLTANPHYWAGPPAIPTIELVSDIGGRSSVTAFEAGDLDLTPVSPFDATWIAYDEALGPLLRRTDGLSLRYYGFDTSRPPFNDVRVRQAFARAVDWRRLIALSSAGAARPATGMVPPGIPGRIDTDYLPALDPAGARALLAAAGFPGGAGFPDRDPARWRGRGPGVRGRDQARARDHDPGRGPGGRLLRSARPGSALDLLDGLDRGLPRAERLPRASSSAAAPRTTTAAGRRPRSTRR